MIIQKMPSPLTSTSPVLTGRREVQTPGCDPAEAPADVVQLSAQPESRTSGWGKKALAATALAVALANSGCATYGGGYGYYGQDNTANVLIGAGLGAIVGGAMADGMSQYRYPGYGYGHQYNYNYNQGYPGYQGGYYNYNPCSYGCY